MIIFSIIGALIGAGFASGQEMYLFFYRYGGSGILGLILCSTLISFVIYKVFIKQISNRNKIKKDLNYNKPRKIQTYMNIVINIFLFITFIIMISGFGTYFEQEYKINKIIGSFILAFLCYVILLKGIEGVTKINTFIVPILIIIVLWISINSLEFININNISFNWNFSWILQSFIYCSYNMILVIPILEELSIKIKSRKKAITISVLSGCIVFILAISVFLWLTSLNVDYSKIDMPAVYVISINFTNLRIIYGFAILLSIFTTAISIGISFAKRMSKDKKNYTLIVGIMCISGVVFSNIGFSNLVKFLFPVFGYLGVIQIINLFF